MQTANKHDTIRNRTGKEENECFSRTEQKRKTEIFLLTLIPICRCGEAECLSFTGTSCEICGNDIYMDICVADYGHNRFHFKKEQYTDSVLNILYILKEKADHDSERQISYLTNTYLSLEEIEKFIGYYKK